MTQIISEFEGEHTKTENILHILVAIRNFILTNKYVIGYYD